MRSIQGGCFEGKKVLIRVDFNLPMTEAGVVTDDRRIRNSLPTIRKVVEEGGVAMLLSHFGRPKQGYDPAFSLKKILPVLASLLQQPVHFAPACVGAETEQLVANLTPGSVVLLENVRFFPEETADDAGFAQSLAALGDVYVNEAFGTIHRNHVSTTLLPTYFAERFAGYGLQAECTAVDRLFSKNDTAPIVAIMGGNKFADKATSIQRFMGCVQHILIGGGLAYPLYKAQQALMAGGVPESETAFVGSFFAQENPHTILSLPMDVASAPALTDVPTLPWISSFEAVPVDHRMFDIGPKTQAFFSKCISEARTIFWAGPMGAFESKPFDAGTLAVAKAIVHATEQGAYSIVGGGDTAAALTQMGYADRVSHVSTGGGALLAYIAANRMLRSLEVLEQ
ncbi:MAG TPA: phosphoglycerate kinase [Amoebophilaceae bacterium]|jgi:phosphoglycerate kinase|nr:phosphoglycerate kinase [Amoebophilaceae bacterium]